MTDLVHELLDELRTWAEENPFADPDELRSTISDLVERASPEPSSSTVELEDRLWEEWARIEAERDRRYGP
jgi:hypothetical protein